MQYLPPLRYSPTPTLTPPTLLTYYDESSIPRTAKNFTNRDMVSQTYLLLFGEQEFTKYEQLQ
jgi:hypothetical protein